MLNVDLNWGDTTDSLRLRIYTPDGYVLGPYFDNADDAVDGRINLDIYNPDGIAKGKWRYETGTALWGQKTIISDVHTSMT